MHSPPSTANPRHWQSRCTQAQARLKPNTIHRPPHSRVHPSPQSRQSAERGLARPILQPATRDTQHRQASEGRGALQGPVVAPAHPVPVNDSSVGPSSRLLLPLITISNCSPVNYFNGWISANSSTTTVRVSCSRGASHRLISLARSPARWMLADRAVGRWD